MSEKKKKFKMPGGTVILFVLLIVMALLTRVIPAASTPG